MKEMLEKWAIYARVSTDREEQKTSVPNQIQFCSKWVVDNGHLVFDTYVDDGISGKSMLIRPDVLRLLADAEAKKINGVVFNNISRFGRDNLDLLWMKRKIVDEWGLRLVALEQGYDSEKDPDEILFIIHSGMSQVQRRALSVQIKNSCLEKAKRGEWPLATPPLGYKRPRKTMREDGTIVRPENFKLQVDPETSPIVKGIFQLASQGFGANTICKALTFGNRPPFFAPIPPLNGAKRWNEVNILKILRNPVYVGTVIFNKGTGSGGRKLNDESKWIVRENAHEPIISKEQFDQVQEILIKRNGSKGISSSNALLIGFTKCGVCDYAMRYDKRDVVSSRKHQTYNHYEYYRCSHDRMVSDLPKQKVTAIRAEHLEGLVLQNVEQLYLNPELIDKMVEDKRQAIELASGNSQAEIKKIDKELAKIDKAFRKDLELFRAEVISIERFKSLQEENEQMREQLLSRKNQLLQATALRESLGSRVQRFKVKLSGFAKLDKTDPTKLKVFLSEIIEKIVVHSPTRVEIHYWEISNIY